MNDTTTASRWFRRQRILGMTPPTYEHAVRLLAAAAEQRFTPISAVVGIANGGLAPASDIGGALAVPDYRLTARHNPTEAIYTEATGHVTVDLDPLAAALDGQPLTGTVLLVDDICGTGATFTAVLPALRVHLEPDAEVRTVALCRNAGSSVNPDLWVWTVDDWVRFPWEHPAPPDMTIEELPMPDRVEPA
jgi:hypoxanthine phosphoribosyltransferase